MAVAPLINYPDNSGTTNTMKLTSNSKGFSFTGVVDSNTIDIQISLNGSGFSSDHSLVYLSNSNFSIPNPSSFPDGLFLEKGTNVIQLKSVDLTGSISPISTITVNVVPEVGLSQVEAPPTGVRLLRKAGSIIIDWSDEGLSGITSFNIYASTGEGGSGSGYLRINQNPIPISSKTSIEEGTSLLGESTIDVKVKNNDNGSNDIKVTSDIINSVTNSLVDRCSTNTYSLLNVDTVRIGLSISEVRTINRYEFEHDRNDGVSDGILNSDVFSTVSQEDPLYYVITSSVFDKNTGELRESRYSPELSGAPLPMDTTIRGLKIREQPQIVQDYITEVQKAQPELSLIPASTIREVHIEPFANEMQKAYFLMDFVSRSKSFEALLQIDDPGRTNSSILVRDSAYKQQLRTALSLSSDAAVQAVIDNAFDSLAGNFGVPRRGRRPATVVQTFYTTTIPSRDLIINQNAVVSSSTNSAAPRFKATASVTLPVSKIQSYFNPTTQRYEIRLQMVAESPGSTGNIPAGSLDTVVSGANGFKTINEASSNFGRDLSSNLELSEEASNVLVSIDSGTTGGYKKNAISTPGLLEVKVVDSGNDYMMRDYDDVRGKHIGGKVDVYVRGTIERVISETFAFRFSVAKNMRFDVVDATALIFRARDSRLSEDNPISEMLYNPTQNLGLRNQSNTPTSSYDLTGVVILDYQTIQLSKLIQQPVTFYDDFIEGDYRFRSNNKLITSKQPIIRITSVVGEVSGALDSSVGYNLYKTQDPLLEGNSTIANDYVEILQVDNTPSGDVISINAEEHTLIGQFEEPLNSVGINEYTLSVYSKDRVTKYKGPTDSNPDYLILSGSQTTPIKLIRTTNSSIPTGSVVSVDYEHDENFVVTYVINDVLQQLQAKYANNKHTTADVIVKQAVENGLALEATVQLAKNADQPTTDSGIRSSITILTDNRGISNPIRQSDATSKIDAVNGVDFVVQPLTRFSLVDGSIRIRDKVPSSYVFIQSLSLYSNAVYILTQKLPFSTTDGGGPITMHRGVFKDDIIMEMSSSLGSVGKEPNNSYIIGRLGAVINGYSDDITLKSLGFMTQSEIDNERINRTANRVIISLDSSINPPDLPSYHNFSASYIVNSDKDTKDIEVSAVEVLVPGEITVTYRS